MGNREDLLDGAVRCLHEKGWARSTVRDIAAAAGVSHAAIGYHFGSREALLTAALVRAIDEWGAAVAEAAAARAPGDDPLVVEWETMVASFTEHRAMWRASIDAAVQAERHPALRRMLADGQEEGRRGGTAALLGLPEEGLPPESVRGLGSVHNALISGVMLQWLIDPERAPSGAEVAAGLRALAGLVTAREPAPPV